jgi:ABC-type multidrug transport system fused ATPase/permease subunit
MNRINWRHPAILNSARAGATAALIILVFTLAYFLLGIWWYSFWLFVFYVTVIPIGLFLYGVFWADRFRWHEMLLGTWVSTWILSLVCLERTGMTDFRLLFSLSASAAATVCSLTGYLLRKASAWLHERLWPRISLPHRSGTESEQTAEHNTSVGG